MASGRAALDPTQQFALLCLELGLGEQPLIAQVGQLAQRLLDVVLRTGGRELYIGGYRLRVEITVAAAVLLLGLQHRALEIEWVGDLAQRVDADLRGGQNLDITEAEDTADPALAQLDVVD